MAFHDFMNPAKMSVARRERFAYWRGVPLRRLRYLLLAVFFTFGSIGFCVSIFTAKVTPLAVGCGWALFSGGVAIAYILVIARRPRWFPLLILGQILANIGWSWLMTQVVARAWLHPASERFATRVFAWGAICFVAVGYSFFLAFIQTEGRQTVRAHTELALAHSIQQTLVPQLELQVAGCEVFGVSVPSDKVGGDVVDVVALADGSATVYVADVAGHGLQAGILMGMLKTAARTRLLEPTEPAKLFECLNSVLPGIKEAHMYATCAALRLGRQVETGRMRVDFAVAGHPAILRICGETGNVEYLSDEQLPLGLFAHAAYRSQTLDCGPGDLLAVTTDGILEVENADGEEFGPGRLETLVRAEMGRPLPDLAATILNAVGQFGKQTDDQTLLLVRLL